MTPVGGTNGTAPEQAVYFSQGGFSNYFGRPSYQSNEVETFLDTLGDQTYAGLYKWVSAAETLVHFADAFEPVALLVVDSQMLPLKA